MKAQYFEEIKSARNKFRKLSTYKKRVNVLNDDTDPTLVKKKIGPFLKQFQTVAVFLKLCTMELNLDPIALIWPSYLITSSLASFLVLVSMTLESVLIMILY